MASLSPLLRSLLSTRDTRDTEDRVTIVLPDITVQEVDTFLSNIYEGSTVGISLQTNKDLFSLFGISIINSPTSKLNWKLGNLISDIRKRSFYTKQSISSDPKDDSIQKMTLEVNKNVEEEEEGHDSDSTLSADPLDTDDWNDYDDDDVETQNTESDHNKAKALELVEIKIKEEDQEEQSNSPLREEEPTPPSAPESEELQNPKKKRRHRYKNPQNDSERIASDPIWEHITNKDCTSNSYSKGSVTCNYCEKTFAFSYAGQHIWSVHKIMVDRPKRYREVRPQEAKTAAYWAHFSEDPENRFRCICQLCGKNLSRISAAKHLRQTHVIFVRNALQKKIISTST